MGLSSDFPLDVASYHLVEFKFPSSGVPILVSEQRKQLLTNIGIVRDMIVFCSALANAKGLGGYTGGSYDIVPEDEIVTGFIHGEPDKIHYEVFEDAGHRAMLRYVRAALEGKIGLEELLHYREHRHGLYGHPERDDHRGIWSSTGRLGHDSAQANGVAEFVKPKKVVLFGSDGAMQEGINAEAARYAAAHGLNITWIVDDNNMTIEGPVSSYLPGFDPAVTLRGHGWKNVLVTKNAEMLDELFGKVTKALQTKSPVAIINKRSIAPGIIGIEGTPKAHDAIPVNTAVGYLYHREHKKAADMLKSIQGHQRTYSFSGSSNERGSNRSEFGRIVTELIEERIQLYGEGYKGNFLVVSNDLGGSCGLAELQKKFPEQYRSSIMEQHNFMLAAGFGRQDGCQGIFGTFSAFLEMVVSQITMARMNESNVLAHFSHAGVDDMADNECHFGTNLFFADCGPKSDNKTRLYFPADPLQMEAMLRKIFDTPGLRFVFSTRSSVPYILDEKGKRMFDSSQGYVFKPGKDELVREGEAGYIVSYGEMLYRCLDVVERLRQEGINVGLVNKPTLNVVDFQMLGKVGSAPFVLVVDGQNMKTGLGIRYGTWLLRKGFIPYFNHMGVLREGEGGLEEQIRHQGLEPENILERVMELYRISH